jgi:hypothetical protein
MSKDRLNYLMPAAPDLEPGQLIVDIQYGSRHHRIGGKLTYYVDAIEVIANVVDSIFDKDDELAAKLDPKANPEGVMLDKRA